MRPIFVTALTVLFALTTAPPVRAHGGGCRKSSPPGQCCHMQTSTGKVHCHTTP